MTGARARRGRRTRCSSAAKTHGLLLLDPTQAAGLQSSHSEPQSVCAVMARWGPHAKLCATKAKRGKAGPFKYGHSASTEAAKRTLKQSTGPVRSGNGVLPAGGTHLRAARCETGCVSSAGYEKAGTSSNVSDGPLGREAMARRLKPDGAARYAVHPLAQSNRATGARASAHARAGAASAASGKRWRMKSLSQSWRSPRAARRGLLRSPGPMPRRLAPARISRAVHPRRTCQSWPCRCCFES